MKEIFELLIYKDGKKVSVQVITNWTAKEIEKLLLILEQEGKTWEYQKTYRWEGKDNEK